ncbi:hypothetical protein MBANPS3_010566 [Mucor bainieri]
MDRINQPTLQQIFGFLDSRDQLVALRVNRHWNQTLQPMVVRLDNVNDVQQLFRQPNARLPLLQLYIGDVDGISAYTRHQLIFAMLQETQVIQFASEAFFYQFLDTTVHQTIKDLRAIRPPRFRMRLIPYWRWYLSLIERSRSNITYFKVVDYYDVCFRIFRGARLHIMDMPQFLTQFTNLQALDLQWEKLLVLHTILTSCPSLQRLNLVSNFAYLVEFELYEYALQRRKDQDVQFRLTTLKMPGRFVSRRVCLYLKQHCPSLTRLVAYNEPADHPYVGSYLPNLAIEQARLDEEDK